MASIIREPHFEQKITDCSPKSDMLSRSSVSFWKSIQKQASALDDSLLNSIYLVSILWKIMC